MRWHGAGRMAISMMTLTLLSAGSCQPATAADTSPGMLDLKIILLDLDDHPTDGKVIVGMQFWSGGKVVQVSTSDIAMCDGVTLTQNALLGNAYAERVPLRAPGQNYHFSYQHSGTTVTVDLVAPARPSITTPTPNASVPRTATVTVTYPTGAGAAVTVTTRTGAGSTTHAEKPDNGTYGSIDLTAAPASSGSVALSRIFRPVISGTAFRSAVGEMTTMSADVPVTWT